jgi:hypothetical protein
MRAEVYRASRPKPSDYVLGPPRATVNTFHGSEFDEGRT